MSAPAQRSYAGGEIAPALYARTDQVKYATGLRTCRNMIVRRHGGASNRPGSPFIAETKNSAVACRLLRFVRDATNIGDTYVIELGNGYARFIQNGGVIVTSGVSAWVDATAYTVGDLVTQGGATYYCTLAHTSANGTDKPGVDAGFATKWYAQAGAIYEIPTPYATPDLPDLTFAQSGDVITLVHPSYAPRELKRFAHTRWTLAPIVFGPSIRAPANIAATGGTPGLITYWAVTAIKEATLEESLPGLFSGTDLVPVAGTPTVLTWDSVAGAISYNVYRSTDGQTYGLINSAGGTPVATSDSAWTDSNETATTTTAGGFVPSAGQMRNPLAAISMTARAYNGKYTVTFALTLTGGGAGGGGIIGDSTPTNGRYDVYYSRDSEPRILGGSSDMLTVLGAASIGPIDTSITIDVPDNGYSTLTIDVVPSVQATVSGQTCTMNVDASSGAVAWLGGVSGFSDAAATPDFTIGPPTELDLFTAGQFPAATTNYQQRRLFGNSTPNPDTVWASRIASAASFAKSTPLQDDDVIQFAIAGEEVNVVKHMIDLGRLIVFTTGGAFLCGDDNGVLTPTTPNPRSIDANGIGRLRPIKVSDSGLFVEARQTIVRDLQPWQSGGALGGYTGKDLTIFAAHLFDGFSLVDWSYAKVPNSIVWAVRSDGTLLGLTYLREHEIWGWHRHDTDGQYENVCVVPEGSEDAVYVVVNRTINGATKRYIERFASRFFTDQADAYFVDCGLSFDGTNTTATTLAVSGGTTWESTELLTVTASGGTPFASTNVGDSAVFTALDGSRVEVVLENFVDTSHMTGHATRTIPTELQGGATVVWTLAVSKVGGLSHLEGKAVSVLGDGFVVASPNNAAYPVRTVTSGVVTFDRAYGILHVGLPYISDLDTLDLDSPGPRTTKDKKSLVDRVGLFVEASRGIWTGLPTLQTDAAPLAGLNERKSRNVEPYNATPTPFTGYVEIPTTGVWDNNGGIRVRQVDPVPLTVLATVPIGFLPGV